MFRKLWIRSTDIKMYNLMSSFVRFYTFYVRNVLRVKLHFVELYLMLEYGQTVYALLHCIDFYRQMKIR